MNENFQLKNGSKEQIDGSKSRPQFSAWRRAWFNMKSNFIEQNGVSFFAGLQFVMLEAGGSINLGMLLFKKTEPYLRLRE